DRGADAEAAEVEGVVDRATIRREVARGDVGVAAARAGSEREDARVDAEREAGRERVRAAERAADADRDLRRARARARRTHVAAVDGDEGARGRRRDAEDRVELLCDETERRYFVLFDGGRDRRSAEIVRAAERDGVASDGQRSFERRLADLDVVDDDGEDLR